MMSNRLLGAVFRETDEVVLAEGTYQGHPGVFVRPGRDDFITKPMHLAELQRALLRWERVKRVR
jgi:hypothetical protein